MMESILKPVIDPAMISCPMCGHSFDPGKHPTCEGCPIQKGCSLVCCPKCGFEMVDYKKSTLYQLVTRIKSRFLNRGLIKNNVNHLTLKETTLGSQVTIAGFHPQMNPERRVRLQAYGLNEGQLIRVIQHSPVTIVLIEHLELAIEAEIAQYVFIRMKP